MAEVDLATLAIRVQSLEAEAAKKRLDELGTAAAGAESKTETLTASTARLVAKYVSFTAIAAAVGAGIRASIGQYATLDAATANLAAKTGLAGESLSLMVDRAKALSGATTQSAAAILDAAEQVEGLVPALGGNAEAIAEVTRQAVILSEATGDELGPSVAAVGQALAQFGLGAGDAARVTNALVAAAQNGAAEVQDLAGAMERIGPAADRAGVSFEQTLAAIELLANKGIRGREAVGGLTEFFDRLSTSTEERFSPAIVGLDTALENLAAANLTAAERTKLFGDSAGTVAGVIVGNLDVVQSLTDKITGTSAATDQAAERLKTFEAQSKMLSNELGNLGTQIGAAVVPYLVSMATETSGLVRALRDLSGESDDAGDGVDTFAGVLRAGAVAALAFTNTLGLAVRTAESLAGALPGAIKGLTNPIEAFRAFGEAGAKIADDYEATVARILRAQERLTTPDDPSGVLTAPAAPGAAAGGASDTAERDEKRKAEARREAQGAELGEREKFTAQYVEYMQKFGDDTLDLLSKSNEKQLEVQIAGDLAKWQAKLNLQEQIKDDDEDRHNLLAERMVEWFETDLEATLKMYQQREDAINEFFDGQTLPNEEERARRLAQVHEQRERSIDQLVRSGTIKRNDFEKLSATQKAQFVLSAAELMTAGLAQHNKAAFQLNKIAGIANATISTYQAAAKALAEGGPFAGPLLAAAITAQGLAQVAAIKGTQFEGGGAGTTPSLAGSGGVVNGNPVAGDTAPPPDISSARGQGSQTQIVIAGNNLMDDYAMDRFIERIGEIVNDKDAKVFGGNSRQAQDIVITQR